MIWLFAAILEVFADFVPEGTPVDHFLPYPVELRAQLLERGWEVREFARGEESTWVFWNLGNKTWGIDLASHPKEKMVLFTWEPPTVMPEIHDPKVHAHFGKVFTWDDDLVDGKKFFKFYYPVLRGRVGYMPPFEHKKFCVMVTRNLSSEHPKQLYTEREGVVRFFEGKKGEFDLYGANWNKKKYKNYRGPVANKLEAMSQYKFAICYENMRDVKGYITEKIFDCFAAGVVPVYWGASNVTDYIPENCFIDRRRFKNNEAMYRFLKRMKKREYEAYLQRAEEFLKSEKAQLFSSAQLARTFLQVVD